MTADSYYLHSGKLVCVTYFDLFLIGANYFRYDVKRQPSNESLLFKSFVRRSLKCVEEALAIFYFSFDSLVRSYHIVSNCNLRNYQPWSKIFENGLKN